MRSPELCTCEHRHPEVLRLRPHVNAGDELEIGLYIGRRHRKRLQLSMLRRKFRGGIRHDTASEVSPIGGVLGIPAAADNCKSRLVGPPPRLVPHRERADAAGADNQNAADPLRVPCRIRHGVGRALRQPAQKEPARAPPPPPPPRCRRPSPRSSTAARSSRTARCRAGRSGRSAPSAPAARRTSVDPAAPLMPEMGDPVRRLEQGHAAPRRRPGDPDPVCRPHETDRIARRSAPARRSPRACSRDRKQCAAPRGPVRARA